MTERFPPQGSESQSTLGEAVVNCLAAEGGACTTLGGAVSTGKVAR